MNLNIKEIMELLPHRYPILLVDRVLEMIPGKSIVAIKNVSINEPFFEGHFPHLPIMPGVLIIEALAQAAAIFSFGNKSHDIEFKNNTAYYLVGIENTRFRRPVVPGDQLRLEVFADRLGTSISKYKAKALVDNQVVAQTDLMCAMRALENNNATKY
ncbi:3-hydroxyacyl-ACP dehydratase FabZ [Candidatus Kinetoplastidibacterium crithidiae]|uniref:3-hydroxyacyl-[acyl-carrier-protein] dehydratase FabZ n=1 Tax=Candidatus Kinetoplastidibacterium crithidiae TCC036E TaxID=1208918 RepID=M1L4H5_9PROT|nr:3-hydroxyacyl-ACP dehydratase FabZ [Candidatus Kinetoplastibacterium crithidii]AFZ82731.1 (3R)-hydroxymyristoyl-ACP dehydratase [Candidatus Kinetoplastibacterium crithidii (ex Angomonas deanei ATCC 30255)]AGF47618.1 3R-hydroxymyristoyl ACP dehydrase [Candidatus Kinetoplastibacterium crithidii TCC036E]